MGMFNCNIKYKQYEGQIQCSTTEKEVASSECGDLGKCARRILGM